MICTIAFLLCIALVYQGTVSVIGHSNAQIDWFHAYRARDALQVRSNSLDVIAIGSSPNISGFSPIEAYAEYGFSSFSAGVGHGSGFPSQYLLLEEMLKTQKPSIVLIEVSTLFGQFTEEIGFRVISDAVGSPIKKIQVLDGLPEGYLQDSKISYVFPILKYHARYKNITRDDFFDAASQNYYNYFMGFNALYGRMNVINEGYPITESSEIAPVDKVQFSYLQRIVDLCKGKEIIPILYKVPWNGSWVAGQYNAVRNFAMDNGLNYIDMNLKNISQDMKFEVHDFNDPNHVNWWGATKVTRYMAKYLHENYNLPDRRDDPDYTYLNKKLERYEREKFNAEFIKAIDLSSYLDLILEAGDGYTAIISAKDDAFNGLDEELRDKLKKLGLQSDLTLENAYRHSLIGVWQDGRLAYEQLSEGIDDPQRDLLEYRGFLPDGMKCYVKSGGWFSGNISDITIDGVQYSKNDRGLNIVIYDSHDGRVVDSIVFDTCADAGITYKR